MVENENLKSTTIKSLIWKFFERIGAQVIQFVISVILARILMPEEYGTIALITVFVTIANVFIQNGLPSALVRKVNADDLDESSVFYCNLFISVVLYLILFFTAPLIADFYEMPVLTSILRVLSITIIIGSYNSMQNAILAKKMLFKRLFISSFSSVLLSGIIGIVMALSDFGVWAIVAQQISSVAITSIVMTFTVKWRPKLKFSFKRLKSLYSFGWKLLASGLLETIYNNIYSLIIGKKYSEADLAYWNKGQSFPSLLVDNINGSVNSVMYPVYSKNQDDKVALKAMVRRSIKLSAYFVFPMMIGLAVCAESVIRLLLGENWLFCVPYLQGWCVCYMFMPVHTANLQVYNALGRSDVYLVLEIIKKVLGIAVLIATIPFGLGWMMIGKIGVSILSSIINAFPNIKILKYSVFEQVKDLLPIILTTALMGGIVYCVSLIKIHYVIVMLIQIVVGIAVYIIISALTKQESWLYCWNYVKIIVRKIKDRKNIVSESGSSNSGNKEAIGNNDCNSAKAKGESASCNKDQNEKEEENN